MRRTRPGFALAAALIVVIAVALMVALLVDASGARARMAAADLDAARLASDAETVLATALGERLDTAQAKARPGTVVATVGADPPLMAVGEIEALGLGLVRVSASARTGSGTVRGLIGRTAFARLVPDSGAGGGVRLMTLPGGGWAPVP
jgi:Tfp pilus assembly protein PilX